MPDGCNCRRLCFLCEAAAKVSGRNRPRPISGQEQSKLYWSEKAGAPPGEVHPIVSQAVMISPSLCEQAWGEVRDKMDNERNRDLERATKLRTKAGFFVHVLKRLIADANRNRRAK